MAKDRFRSGNGDIDIPRLCQAMQRSRLAMMRPRQTIVNIAREVAGPYWSEEGAPRDVVVNLLAVGQTVVSQSLVPKNPRVMLSTFRPSIKPAVAAMQTWANQQIEHIGLKHVLRRIVINSLYSFGIAKVCLADPARSAGAAWNLRAGEPCIWSVDVDDYCPDIHARDWSEFTFEAHRYRVPFDAVHDSRLYSKWVRNRITPSYDSLYNEQGDERISLLGKTTYASDSEEFMPMIDLWEVYLPQHRKVITLVEDQVSGPIAQEPRSEALREQTWIGPDRGPFLKLGFGTIPGNWMPKGPMQDWLKLHLAHNNAMRKLTRCLENIKEVTLVRQGASKDGEAVIAANDGDVIDVADPQSVQQLVLRGNHAQLLLAMSTALKDMFSFVAGNIELLGGRSPQSKTATQDRMLDENANAGISNLQDQTIDFTSDVLKSLCWYWWHDPQLVMHTKHSLPGLPDLDTRLRIYPNGYQNQQGQSPPLQRKGKFEELGVKVDPYSLQHMSPQQRFQKFNEVVQQIIIPMMGIAVQQGKTFDLNAYLQKAAEWLDEPDLGEIITIEEPPEADAQQGLSDKPPMPSSSNREYTRNNVSQRTPQSDSQQLIAQMLGHKMGGTNNQNGAMKLGVQ